MSAVTQLKWKRFDCLACSYFKTFVYPTTIFIGDFSGGIIREWACRHVLHYRDHCKSSGCPYFWWLRGEKRPGEWKQVEVDESKKDRKPVTAQIKVGLDNWL